MFHCEQPIGRIIPSAKCTNCRHFIPQSKTPLIHFPSSSYLVPTSTRPGINSWPDHINQICRSQPAELSSHCSHTLFIFQLDTLLFSFFTFTVFLYMFRTGWSIIRRIKLHVQPLAPFPHSLLSRAWPLATHEIATNEGKVPEAARVI